MKWNIYLSGEIHTSWRDEIIEGCKKYNLDVDFSSAVTNHEASDSAGDVLGVPTESFFRDNQSSKINAIRTKTLIKKCDLAIIRFGDKYKQWNAAFDAGCCMALDKPYITLHHEDIIHPLKEVDAGGYGWAKDTEQVVELLNYIINK